MGADRQLRLVPTCLDAAPDEIAREISIDAPTEMVFSYLVDPAKHVQWQGVDADLDARPGGALRITFAPGYVAAGTYIDVDPPRHLRYTWGWEQQGADTLPPGSSTVDITLESTTSGGTILRMRHTGLPGPMLEFHTHGWDECLVELARRATAAS